LEKQFKAKGWHSQRYSQSQSFDQQIMLVDEIGRLQELYLWGHCAFVGGSFKDKVHSVMEPLAAGCPVVIGPYHLNNREALHFQHKRLQQDLFIVSPINNAMELQRWLTKTSVFTAQNDLKMTIQKMSGATVKLKDWIKQQLQLF
jgi:3-deoxy-D-manno-octulosonic-acid transferase